jgi:uncharacterized membrane protein
MVVRKMKKHLEKAGMTMIGAAVSLIGPPYVFAHIVDERPGLGTGMTIILSVFWVAVVLGLVFFVRRLMRPRHSATGNRSIEDNHGREEKRPEKKD